MFFSLRAAAESDQPTIDSVVRAAQINPSDLKWPNFIVAESEGQIVGVGQVKQHRDGSRELASIAVRPGYKRQGVGSAICRALVEREKGRLHLMCRDKLEAYYTRFGFRRVEPDGTTPYFRRIHRLASVLTPLVMRQVKLIVMTRDSPVEG